MFKESKLSNYLVKKVVECFCLDLTARQTAGSLKLNRKAVNALYQRFRLLICLQRMNQRRPSQGVVEVDECYFGPRRGLYPDHSPIALPIPCGPSFGDGSTRRASSAPMAGPVTMAWSMSARTSTCASTSKSLLPKAALTSTASKLSGASPSAAWPSSTESSQL